jgi:hypothetical protein
MALSTFRVIFGVVTLIAGGAGGTTTIAGVYQILDPMVEAHGIYVECLYAHIANQETRIGRGRRHTAVVLCGAIVVLSLASCRREGGIGEKRPEPRGPIGKLLEIRRMLADPSYQFRGVPPHQQLGWKAEDSFADPKVIALCKAIEPRSWSKSMNWSNPHGCEPAGTTEYDAPALGLSHG